MSTINHKIEMLNADGTKYDTYHPETNTSQIYDFEKSKWLSEIIDEMDGVAKNIQLRGLEKDLPVLKEGQIAFTTDTKKIFIGGAGGNIGFVNKEEIEKEIKDLSDSQVVLESEVTQQLNQIQNNKVTKIAGKQLSTNDYTTSEKSLVAQIPRLARQDFVDSQFASIVSGAPKATYATYTALKDAYPNGTDGIMLVLENGHWYYWNDVEHDWLDGGVYQSQGIADGGVTLSKIVGYQSANLFDKSLFEYKILNNVGEGLVVGNRPLVGNTGWIQVKPNKLYETNYKSSLTWIVEYDVNQQFLRFTSNEHLTGESPYYFVSGDNTHYVKCNVDTEIITKEQYYFGEVGTQDDLLWMHDILSNHTPTIKPKNIAGFVDVNLFNKNDVEYKIFNTNGEGLFIRNRPKVCNTGFIAVEPNESYETNYNKSQNWIAEYDSNKQFVKMNYASTDNYAIKTTNNTRYIRATIDTEIMALDDYVFKKTISKERYGWVEDLIDKKMKLTDNQSRFGGVKLLVSGDSITEKNFRATKNWHDYLKDWLGFSVVKNDGKSGTGIIRDFAGSNGMYYRIDDWDTKYGEFDVILIMGNMNDGGLGATNFPLGEFTDTVATQSQYGALHAMIQKLLTKYPNKPIGWVISQPRLSGYGDQPTPHAWGKDSWFEPYAQAIKEVCEHYSIPCLDLYHNSGLRPWLPANNAMYFSEPGTPNGDGTHPNALGQEIMAQKIHEFVKQYL